MKKNFHLFLFFFCLTLWCCLSSPSFAQQDRIVGGQPVTDLLKYPWIAALVDGYEADINYGQFCGGTLIAPGWVVTAAHCVCESPNDVIATDDIDAVLGAVDLKANSDTYERIEVSRIIVNPDYDPNLTDNDVALLKLKSVSAQKPIDFLATPETDPSLSIDSLTPNTIMTTAIGWGETQAQTRSYPNQLQEVDLPLVSNQECGNFFGEGEITENMLCAGFPEGGKDSCFGDSGGPLVIPYSECGYNLIGIVSWGYGCAQPNSYGVYTRVSKMRDWIFEQIRLTIAPIVLKDSTLTTIYSGSDLTVYGCNGVNNLTIQSGARAKLINFPGSNNITIKGSSSLFSVSHSGATVTFENENNGTKVVIPATKNIQLITFDDLTTILQIQFNKVMLGKQEVTRVEKNVDPV